LLALASWAQSLEVIELRYRSAEELIPVIQPLLAPGDSLSGEGYKLFIRTSPENLSQLRNVIAQLDREPRQLLISVRNATRQELEREGAAISGAAHAGSRSGANVTIRATDQVRQEQRGSIASARVIEGHSARLVTGSSVPIITAIGAGHGRASWAAAATEYRETGSGFIVTPRVRGTQVVLDVEQQDERHVDGRIETLSASTQVAGALGEWIELAGISESGSASTRGLLGREYRTSTDERSIWIKVDAL
jgi:type II secretory pathway component GspD/PulD (secretin)